jgi:hypothetical protein
MSNLEKTIPNFNCLACQEPLQLPEYVKDTYKGIVVCANEKCKAHLKLKLVKGEVREYDIAEFTPSRTYEIVQLSEGKKAKEAKEALEKLIGKKAKEEQS